MRRAVIAALALVLASGASAQPTRFDPQPLIAEALARTRALSFRAESLDWGRIEAEMRRVAAGATDPLDVLPAYAILTRALGDNHSFVNVAADRRAAYRARHGREFDAGLVHVRSITSRFTDRRAVAGTDLAIGRGRVRLLTVPMLLGGGKGAAAYGQALHDAVAVEPRPCGYIVDLRGNGGGNMWPMMLGLGRLLGDGPSGRLITPAGRRYAYVRLSRDAVTIADGEQAGLNIVALERPRAGPALGRVPVAVLIDDGTGSSGAGVAVAFHGRAASRFFGQRTSATVSSNEGFVLPDGTNIVVTTEMMADRGWRTFPDGIAPDEATPAGEATVMAARGWLRRQPSCRAAR